MKDAYYIEEYNLYNILNKELIEKGINWTTKEKMDYIYIRLCQIFNYDERWSYTSSEELRQAIFSKKTDIYKVNTSKVVCSTFSEIFKDLLLYLLSNDENFDFAQANYVKDTNHVYVTATLKDGTYVEYDPILNGNDFLNATKGLPIHGINIDNKLPIWENELEQEKIYHNIGYKTDYLKYLNLLKEEVKQKDIKAKELFNYLVKTTNTNNIGMYELNNLFNYISKYIYNKNLNELGIFLNSEELNNKMSFYYLEGFESKYKEEEKNGKVILKELKKRI